MSEEELSRSTEMDNLYIIFPMIDYSNVKNNYQNMKPIESPIIASNMGSHMSQEKINNLLETEI